MVEYLKPVSKQCTKTILEQMNNISFGINKQTNQICFFTKIKYKNKNIPVMITNYQIINYIANNNYINIYINNELNKIEIRKGKYFNKDYDLAVIQIKNNNKIKFLELDENVYEKEIENYYNNESIYIIDYNKNDISVVYNIINNINNYEIFYSRYLNNNDNILPIFNLSNNKLIGIHIKNSKYYYKGLLFNFIINEFIEEYKIEKIDKYVLNKIEIVMKINKSDINEDIYFLDKEKKNNEFDELNNSKIELYINNTKNNYQKYFKPNKEGEYKIKLKFIYNLANCDYMFDNCENIIKINFVSFNTKYITSMKYMFHKCKNLEYINNLFIFDTKNVIDMSNMFSFCNNLNNLDISSFNTKKVKNISYMFYCCYKLKNLKLFHLNTQNSINIDYIFDYSCIVNRKPFNIKSYNKYSNEIDIIIKVYKNHINKKTYFLDNYESEYYDEIKHFHDGLKELNDKNTELYINNIKYKYKKYFIPKEEGEYKIKLKFNINLTDCSYMFAKCNNIIHIDFICFNSKYIRTMNRMFYCCNLLNNLDLSSFDTKNVTDMSYMFYFCEYLNNLDISSFDTKNVTNMGHMFYHCNRLNNLDLSSFDTQNVTDMSYMFYNCENLNNLDLSSFDTQNVTDMINIFFGCPYKIYESNKYKFKRFNEKDLTSKYNKKFEYY